MVFLSYAHASIEHKALVRQLWLLLRQLGVDARIDLADEGPGQDWPPWMVQQIQSADFVIVVASAEYRRAAEEGRNEESSWCVPCPSARGSMWW